MFEQIAVSVVTPPSLSGSSSANLLKQQSVATCVGGGAETMGAEIEQM